jgi:signal transduction histidine kinase
MAIVYNLVTSALGGTIDVASREGAGTAVTLVFPKRVPAMAD